MMQRKVAVRPDDVETRVCEWVTAKILSEPRESGLQSLGAVSIFFDPGKGHARHNHPEAEQLIFVIAGQAEMMIEFEEGTPSYQTIKTGDLVSIPKGAYHSTINNGWEPVRILAVYSPPSPVDQMRAADFDVYQPGEVPRAAVQPRVQAAE